MVYEKIVAAGRSIDRFPILGRTATAHHPQTESQRILHLAT